MLLIWVRQLTIYDAMHNAQRIVSLARARYGRTVVRSETLAGKLGQWLVPHQGEPLTHEEALAEALEHGCSRYVQYDQRLSHRSQAVIDRIIALSCAEQLIEEFGGDAGDVDYVASALCGLPRPIVKASARMIKAAAV